MINLYTVDKTVTLLKCKDRELESKGRTKLFHVNIT